MITFTSTISDRQGGLEEALRQVTIAFTDFQKTYDKKVTSISLSTCACQNSPAGHGINYSASIAVLFAE